MGSGDLTSLTDRRRVLSMELTTPSTVLADLRARGLIRREWVCDESLIRCTPDNEHGPLHSCGWRWRMDLIDSPIVREMLGVADDE